jgi:hypothetical protein
LFSIKTLFVENLGHLAVNSGKLGIITICAEGVSAVEGVLIALEGHGGLAVVVVGAPQKDGYDGQQMSHGAKVQNISESYIALDTKNIKKWAKTCHDDGFIKKHLRK